MTTTLSTWELVDVLTTEARKIVTAAQAELAEEGLPVAGIRWTGQSLVMAGSKRVWYLFETPGSWEGKTWMRLTPGGNVMTREPADMEEA